MLRILVVLFIGIAAGRLLRRSPYRRQLPHTTLATVVILLFVMGMEIGSDGQIVRNLPSLGGTALAIALAATAGSLVAARIAYRFLFGRKGGGDAR